MTVSEWGPAAADVESHGMSPQVSGEPGAINAGHRLAAQSLGQHMAAFSRVLHALLSRPADIEDLFFS